MKIRDVYDNSLIENIDLVEVNMSPGSLRKLAAEIQGAQAGMEFEMIVPGAAGEEDEEFEPDWDADERVNSFREIMEFFTGGDFSNSRRDVQSVIDDLQSKYEDYAMETESEQWQEVQDEETRRYVEENEWDEESKIREYLETQDLSEEDIEEALMAGDRAHSMSTSKEDRVSIKETEAYHRWAEARDSVSEMLDEYVSDAVSNQSDAWQMAYDEWREGWEWPDESYFLEHEGIETMRDVYNLGDLTWPYMMGSNNGGQPVEDVADEFGTAIGRPWNASSNYHGAKRAPGKYVIEPDGSLEPDDPYSEAGLEFVSPPLPVTELLSDLRKVVSWAKNRGCYTNDSTGLHINVSVPNFSIEKLDYVKLAILLGDEYVLQQFGRAGNTYCKSALKIVKDHITQRPQDAEALLGKMREQLNASASKLIHSGITSKYTSINTKDGYVEFRSPGGDWLAEDLDKIESTLLRFVVALDAAIDETKYKEEYAKKLYKLLSPSNDSTDSLQYFVKFSAGELPRSALASFVKQVQLQRKLKKGPTGEKYWWSVGRPGHGASVEVVASSREEAIEKGRAEYPDWSSATNIQAKPLRPYDSSPVRASVGEPQPAGAVGGGEFTGTWKIVDGNGRELHRFSGIGNNQTDANRFAIRWLTSNGYGHGTEVSVLPVMG